MNSKDLSKPPLVSIITPAYNAMPYLEKTIKSVLEQDYPNLEHIIIDGGSNDNSVEILKSYSHLTWVSEKDSGQSHALNKGFAIVTGEIIGWLNADDTYEPNAIQQAVNYFLDHPGADYIGTDLKIINEDGKVIGCSSGGEFDLLQLLIANMIKQPTVFMRRSMVNELGGVNQNLHFVMDRELWLRAGISGFKYHYLKGSIFANFRLIRGTKSFESSAAFHAEWYKVIVEELKNKYFDSLSIKEKQRIMRKVKSMIYFSGMIDGIELRKRGKIIINFFSSINEDHQLIYNKGAWKIFFLGLLGIKFDKLLKFKKNKIVQVKN